MKKYTPWLVVVGVILVVGLWLVGSYNRFVGLGEQVNTAWADVQTDYQRRADLIPNLVATVQGFAKQEKSLLVEVTEARAKATALNIDPKTITDPAKFAEFQAAQGQLSGSLGRLLVSVEAYPQLKSNENFLALQNQLEGTENRIKVSRQRFNESAQAYNVLAKGIPGKWLVSWYKMDASKVMFSAAAGSENAPKVDFAK